MGDEIGGEPNHVKLRRRREERVDHVHDIPFNQPEKPEVVCPDCGESIGVGIYGTCEVSYDSCWGLDCDAYHKFRRDRDAETYADEASTESETVQTKLVTDGGVDRSSDEPTRTAKIEMLYQQRMTVEIPVREMPATPESAFHLVKNTDPEFVNDVIPNTWGSLLSAGSLNVVDIEEADDGY